MAADTTSSSSEPIVYVDHSDIREGLDRRAPSRSRLLVEFIDAHEPRLIAYGFYVDDVARKMTVVAVHPDPASLELHMQIGAGSSASSGT